VNRKQVNRLLHNFNPYSSKYTETSSFAITWGFIRNSKSQSLPQTYRIGTSILTRSPGDSCSEMSGKHPFNPLFIYFKIDESFME
jgi:hypothetical protein